MFILIIKIKTAAASGLVQQIA